MSTMAGRSLPAIARRTGHELAAVPLNTNDPYQLGGPYGAHSCGVYTGEFLKLFTGPKRLDRLWLCYRGLVILLSATIYRVLPNQFIKRSHHYCGRELSSYLPQVLNGC